MGQHVHGERYGSRWVGGWEEISAMKRMTDAHLLLLPIEAILRDWHRRMR